jgi:hypothetical protein
MVSPGQLEALAKAQLRYFRYQGPQGGFGGDWDSLEANARVGDEAELRRVLAVLGCDDAQQRNEQDADLGTRMLGGQPVQVYVRRRAPFPPHDHAPEVRFLLAVYVLPEHLAQAARLEAWLDAHGVPMLPA